MKKITLVLLGFMFTTTILAQTYSTGLVPLLENEDISYSAQIDISNSLVTLTLIGPDNRYLGLGFGVQSMTSGGDAVIFLNDGTFKLTDRSFGYPGQPDGEVATGVAPQLDDNQDWTLVSNILEGDQRTIIATRLPDTGDSRDYVFSNSDTFVDMVWSIGFSYGLTYHGENRGIVVQSITLSQNENTLTDFKIIQNPSKSKLMLSLSNSQVKLEVFDVLGKKIVTKQLSGMSSSIDVSKWNNGVYLVRVISDSGTQTKRFIKQ